MNDIELFAENELTVAESDERAFHEKVVDDVKDGIEKLASIGDASLKVLRDKRLYRSTHKTFEEYCQERFGIVRRQADRQIGFATLLEDLRPRGLKSLPTTEKQARPLTKLETPELQAQAWTQAQVDSGKDQPSNREVAKAVAKVQAELDAEKQRSEEFRQESNERRKKVRELEEQIDLLATRDRMLQARAEQAEEELERLDKLPLPEPEKVVVPPEDYETSKARLAELEAELVRVKKEQARLVNDQLKAKLNERTRELDEMERRKAIMEDQVERMKNYLASLNGEARRIEVHQKVIEENRQHMISLASFLNDEEPMQDADTRKLWNALADMLAEAATAVRQYAGDSKPALTVIQGGAA